MNNVYIYEHTLTASRYQKTLARLETRLTDLGLGGKIYRLAPMTRVDDIIKDELRKAAKTIVVVGGDGLITRVAGLMAESAIPLAIIPVTDNVVSASALGINSENACRTLAARRIVRIDLGKVSGAPVFISEASITAVDPVIKIDDGVVARSTGITEIQVVNVLPDDYGYRGPVATPEDGRLNTYILKTESGFLKKDISQSSIICKRVEFMSGPYKAVLDGGLEVEGVREITVLPQALSVIVGKERKF